MSERNRLSEIFTNTDISRKVFGDLPFMLLEILIWVNDYNHYINFVNLAN